MAVAIEIRHTSQAPAGRKSWAIRRADINIVVQIPDRRLMRAGILKDVVRMAVAVKVEYRSPGCCCLSRRPKGEKSTHSGGKGASHSARSEFIDVAAEI